MCEERLQFQYVKGKASGIFSFRKFNYHQQVGPQCMLKKSLIVCKIKNYFILIYSFLEIVIIERIRMCSEK